MLLNIYDLKFVLFVGVLSVVFKYFKNFTKLYFKKILKKLKKGIL